MLAVGSSVGPCLPEDAAVLNVAILLGSTRPGRRGEAVAHWILDQLRAAGHPGASFELVDVAEQGLPLLDEPLEPSQGRYDQFHTRRWAEIVDRFDAWIIVTPEYNHGPPAALKNALDFVYAEWNDRAAGFVSYGSAGGLRAVEQLRLVMAELQVATVRAQVAFSLRTDWEQFRDFRPADHHRRDLDRLAGQLLAWAGALKALRAARQAPPA